MSWPRGPIGRALVGAGLIGVGTCAVLAAIGLWIGYSMSESTQLGLLLRWALPLGVFGIAAIWIGSRYVRTRVM